MHEPVPYQKYRVIYNRIMIAVFLSILVVLPGRGYSQEGGKVNIAGCDYPPYHCTDEAGLATEMIAAVFGAVNMESEVELLPLKRRNFNFINLVSDAHVPGKVHLQGDEAKDTETVVFYYANICLVYYTPNLKKEDLEKLKNFDEISALNYMRAATIQNSATSALFEKNGFKVDYAEDVSSLVKMLKKDRVKIISLVDVTALTAVSEIYDIAESADFDISKPLITVPLGIAFHKKHRRYEELLGSFRKGLDIIKKNGEYIRVFEHYYGENNVPINVLSDDMRQYGADKTDIKKFMSYKRGLCGRIIK